MNKEVHRSPNMFFLTSTTRQKVRPTEHMGKRINGNVEGVRQKKKLKYDTFDLICRNQWGKLREQLKTQKGRSTFAAQKYLRNSAGRNALHVLCMNQPPLDIVQKFIDVCPDLAIDTDMNLWTPLHAAVYSTTNRSIVECLLSANSRAVEMMDTKGRTALNIAAQRSNLEVIRALIACYPRAVLIEDTEGMTPLEHAIVSEAPLCIVQNLMKTTAAQASFQKELNSYGSCCPEQDESTTLGKENCAPMSFEMTRRSSDTPLPDSDTKKSTDQTCFRRSLRSSEQVCSAEQIFLAVKSCIEGI